MVYAFIIIGGRDGAVVVGSGGVPVSAAPGTKFVVQTIKLVIFGPKGEMLQ